MKISAKGRYALAAMTHMAQRYDSGEYITVLSIADRLGISKIYLEQVFSLLKRGGLVISIKGAQGGYQLSKSPSEITAFDILSAVELSLFEPTDNSVMERAPEIEKALKIRVFEALDAVVKSGLEKVTLLDLVMEAERHREDDAMMFYI